MAPSAQRREKKLPILSSKFNPKSEIKNQKSKSKKHGAKRTAQREKIANIKSMSFS